MKIFRVIWGLFSAVLDLVGRLGSSAAISTFGLFLFVRSPSWKTGLLVLGLVGLQWGLGLLYQNVSDLLHMKAARRGFLRSRREYDFRILPLNDPIVEAGHYDWAGRNRLEITRKAVHAYHKGRLEPLIIYQGTSTGGSDLFPACASYPGINIASVVLILDDPARTPVARFRFYHELAHVGWLAPSSASYRLSIDPYLLLIILLICTSGLPVVLGCLWVLVRVLSLKVGFAELQEELVADRIALHQLGKVMPPIDVERVVQMLERGAKAAIQYSGHRAGLAYTRARAARRYAKIVDKPPHPFIQPRKFEGCIGLGTLYAAVFLDGGVSVTWLGTLGAWLAAIATMVLYWLLLGFVLGSGDRLIYDKNIDNRRH